MRVGTSHPGQWRTVPDPPADVREATQSEREGCLRLLVRMGAMDVALMLGLTPQPPRGPCGCGKCWRCNDRARRAKPWTCPTCGRVLNQGGAGQHLRKVHGVQRA